MVRDPCLFQKLKFEKVPILFVAFEIGKLPSRVFKHLHEFEKGTVTTSKTKQGGIISGNPSALSTRTFKVPGRRPAPFVHPLKEQGVQVKLIVNNDSDYVALSLILFVT